jgi:hypothetical protein
MTWWDFFNSVPVAAGMLGAILGLVVWLNTRDVNRHIRAMRAESDAQIQAIRAGTAATLAQMDARRSTPP